VNVHQQHGEDTRPSADARFHRYASSAPNRNHLPKQGRQHRAALVRVRVPGGHKATRVFPSPGPPLHRPPSGPTAWHEEQECSARRFPYGADPAPDRPRLSYDERQTMATCITCGAELPAERAEKYDYCTAADCQAENLKGLTMVAIAQNKAADEYRILDAQTREEMASGRYRDQRRTTFGPPPNLDHGGSTASPVPATPTNQVTSSAAATRTASRPVTAPKPARRPWSRSQEKLALLYNEQGLRPDEIARRLGLSTYTVTQIVLSRRNRKRR
jgi:hypothetical protein